MRHESQLTPSCRLIIQPPLHGAHCYAHVHYVKENFSPSLPQPSFAFSYTHFSPFTNSCICVICAIIAEGRKNLKQGIPLPSCRLQCIVLSRRFFFFSLTHGRLHENFRCYSKISQHSLIAFQLQLLGLSFYLFLDFSTSDNSHKNKKKFHHFPTMTSEIFTFLAKKKNILPPHTRTRLFLFVLT